MSRDDKRGLLARIGISLCLSGVAIVAAVILVPGLHMDWRPREVVAIGLLWAVVNLVLGSILRLVTLPLRIITLGLISVAINGLLLVVTAAISSNLSVDGLVPALVGAIVLGLVNMVGQRVVGDD